MNPEMMDENGFTMENPGVYMRGPSSADEYLVIDTLPELNHGMGVFVNELDASTAEMAEDIPGATVSVEAEGGEGILYIFSSKADGNGYSYPIIRGNGSETLDDDILIDALVVRNRSLTDLDVTLTIE